MRSNTPPRAALRLFSRFNAFIYQISGGRLMAQRNHLPLLLLTTTGRLTGKRHTVPLVYLKDHEEYVVMPGVYEQPDWYLNLRAKSKAIIQMGNKKFKVSIEFADSEERNRYWKMVPQYWRDYQAQYSASLPLVILKPSS